MNKDTIIIRYICMIIGTSCAILVVGFVGGLETGRIDDMNYIISQLVILPIFGLSLLNVYWMEVIEEGRTNGSRKNV